MTKPIEVSDREFQNKVVEAVRARPVRFWRPGAAPEHCGAGARGLPAITANRLTIRTVHPEAPEPLAVWVRGIDV